jgi:DNA processing protein
MDDERLLWLRMALARGLGTHRKALLIETFGSPGVVFSRSATELADAEVEPGAIHGLLDPRRILEAENELARVDRLGITLLTLGGEAYPELLGHIPDPPVVLGVLGDPGALSGRAVAVVGSRDAPRRYREIARRMGRELAEAGVVVVSGLAKGVDRAAHEGALDAKDGRTVAVLGNGLARVYPTEHRRLAARIRERGALVSELPVDAPPSAEHFPMRNRIVSGLAKAVVVVAGARTSGALHTSKAAEEQGRDIYAVPGMVDDPLAYLPNGLIKDGADLVEAGLCVLRLLKWVEEKPGMSHRPPLVAAPRREPLGGLAGEIEAYLVDYGRPRFFDDIVIDGRFAPGPAMAALGELELDRRVQRVGGGAYEAT